MIGAKSCEVLFSETGFLHLRGTGHIAITPFISNRSSGRHEKLESTGAIRVKRGNIYNDRNSYSLQVFDINSKLIAIYHEHITTCFQRAKIKIPAVIRIVSVRSVPSGRSMVKWG